MKSNIQNCINKKSLYSNLSKTYRQYIPFYILVILTCIFLIFNNIHNHLYAYGISGKVSYGFGDFKNTSPRWDMNGLQMDSVIANTDYTYILKYDKASIFSIALNLSLPLIPIRPEFEISRIIVPPSRHESFSIVNPKNPTTSTPITISSENLISNTLIVNFIINPVFIDFFITPYAGLGFGTGFFHYYRESEDEKRLVQALAGATIAISDELYIDVKYKILSSFSNLDFYFTSTDPTPKNLHLNMPFLIKNMISISLGYKF